MVLFELKNIAFSFSSSHDVILSNIALSIQKNRMIAIMGLNGAGKTTLLRLLSGFFKPTSGEILLSGKRLDDYDARTLAQNVAWIAQDFHPDFPFTAKEFILMGRFAHSGFFSTSHDYKIVKEMISRLHLQDLATRMVTILSGGERQRVLIARALAQQSPVILLDEPTNHLDIKHKTEVLALLKNEVKTNDKSVVAVIHDLADARRYFDGVILLREGRVEFAGAVDDGLNPEWVKKVFEVEV